MTRMPDPHAPMTQSQASQVVTRLERRGWRAEYHLPGVVEVRDLSKRWTPLIATLRTQADVAAFDLAHPEHGLVGRRGGCTGMPGTPRAEQRLDGAEWPPYASVYRPQGE